MQGHPKKHNSCNSNLITLICIQEHYGSGDLAKETKELELLICSPDKNVTFFPSDSLVNKIGRSGDRVNT